MDLMMIFQLCRCQETDEISSDRHLEANRSLGIQLFVETLVAANDRKKM